MKYVVTVKPNAKISSIMEEGNGRLSINVKSPAQDGKANEELIRIIARFLKIPQSHIFIKRGASGRKKIVEIV